MTDQESSIAKTLTPEGHEPELYAVAERMVATSLRSGTSLLAGDEGVWTPEHAAEVRHLLATDPDGHDGSFRDRLRAQLEGRRHAGRGTGRRLGADGHAAT